MSAKKHRGHKKKSEVEETEDLLFSDVDVHKLKPRKQHEKEKQEKEKQPQKVEEPKKAKKEEKQSKHKHDGVETNDYVDEEGNAKEIRVNFHPQKLKKVAMIALFLFLAVSFNKRPPPPNSGGISQGSGR